MDIFGTIQLAAATPAPAARPVSAIVHRSNEYWGYRLDARHFRTCEGKIIVVDPVEKSVPIDVSCSDDGFDEHALHPKAKRTHHPKP